MVSLLPSSLSGNTLISWAVGGMMFTGFFYAAQAAIGQDVYNFVRKDTA